jgi:hypothetical protein
MLPERHIVRVQQRLMLREKALWRIWELLLSTLWS